MNDEACVHVAGRSRTKTHTFYIIAAFVVVLLHASNGDVYFHNPR